MTHGIGKPLNQSIGQSHIDRSGCRLFNFATPLRRLSLRRVSLVSTRLQCFLSPSARTLTTPPLYLSPSLLISRRLPSHRLLQTVDCQRRRNGNFFFFYVEEKLCVSQLVRRRALARPHSGRGRSRCWRVAVAKLSGALVPLGRTFIVGRKLSREQFAFATSVV